MMAESNTSDDAANVFEFVFSTDSRSMLYAVVGSYLVCAFVVPVSLVAARRLFADGQSLWGIVVGLLFFALPIFCLSGAIKLTWNWLHPLRWGIELHEHDLCWFTPSDIDRIATAEIARISVHDDWERPCLIVTGHSGEEWRVHPNCLGKLDEFCRQFCILNPSVSVTYTGPHRRHLQRELGRSLDGADSSS